MDNKAATAERAINRAISMAGTQKKLAEIAGVSQAAVHKWSAGGGLRLDTAKKISEATGISLDELAS